MNVNTVKNSKINTWANFVNESYCPTVLILGPGQLLLIIKNRLHSFRKMSFDQLPDDDCHASMRKERVSILRQEDPDLKIAPLCVSVAWDWYVIYYIFGGEIVACNDRIKTKNSFISHTQTGCSWE